MIGVIRNALNLLNVGIFYQLIVIGVVIVIAVEADVLRSHLEARARPAGREPAMTPLLALKGQSRPSPGAGPGGCRP